MKSKSRTAQKEEFDKKVVLSMIRTAGLLLSPVRDRLAETDDTVHEDQRVLYSLTLPSNGKRYAVECAPVPYNGDVETHVYDIVAL